MSIPSDTGEEETTSIINETEGLEKDIPDSIQQRNGYHTPKRNGENENVEKTEEKVKSPIMLEENRYTLNSLENNWKCSEEESKSNQVEPIQIESEEIVSEIVTKSKKSEIENTLITDTINEAKNLESEKELMDSDNSSMKENIDKSNVLSDDLIFVKPKDKDRGHCYWYIIYF